MNGQTDTGRERLRVAVDAAHEAVQEAHARLYDVELALERAEGDLIGGGMPRDAIPEYVVKRTEIAELRPLLVPVVRWLQKNRRGIGSVLAADAGKCTCGYCGDVHAA